MKVAVFIFIFTLSILLSFLHPVLSTTTSSSSSKMITIEIGMLMPFSQREDSIDILSISASHAVQAAFYHLQRNTTTTRPLLPLTNTQQNNDLMIVNVEVVNVDTQGSTLGTLKAARYLDENKKVVAAIGDVYSINTQIAALYFSTSNIPLCSGGSTSQILTEKSSSPFFFRTITSDDYLADAALSFIRSMNWTKIAILATTTVYGQGMQIRAIQKASELNVTVLTSQSFSRSGFSEQLKVIKGTQAKIIFLICEWTGVNKDILEAAKELNMFGDDYVFITTEMFQFIQDNKDSDVTQGMIYLQALENADEQGEEEFLNAWNSYSQYSNKTVELSYFSMFYYDCAQMILHGLKRLLQLNPSQTIDSIIDRNLSSQLNYTFFSSIQINGVTGDLRFDSNGDRLGSVGIFNHQGNGKVVEIARFTDSSIIELEKPMFYDGSSKPPLDSNPEFFVSWTSSTGITICFFGALGVAIHICILIFLIVYRNNKIVVSSSFFFCCLIVFGSMMMSASVFTLVGYPTDLTCIIRPWLFAISFSLVFANLTGKTWRIFRIFHMKNAKVVVVTNAEVLMYTSPAVLVDIALLALWTGLDSPFQDFLNEERINSVICSTGRKGIGSGFGWTLLVFNIAVATAGAYMALRTRTVPTQYRESRYIGLSLYNILALGAVILPILFVSRSTSEDVRLIILTLGIFLSSNVTSLLLFAPKMLMIHGIHRQDSMPSDRSNSFRKSAEIEVHDLAIN